jgi:hypothetical protein
MVSNNTCTKERCRSPVEWYISIWCLNKIYRVLGDDDGPFVALLALQLTVTASLFFGGTSWGMNAGLQAGKYYVSG